MYHTRGVILKRILIIMTAAVLIASLVLVACSKSTTETSTTVTTQANLSGDDTEYGFETEAVTDEDGKTVTDKDGKNVTTEVAVIYKTDKNGKHYAQKLDDDGNEVTDSKGKAVTVKSDRAKELDTTTTTTTATAKNTDSTTADGGKNNSDSAIASTEKPTSVDDNTTAKPTGTTKKNVDITKESNTTKFDGNEKVPKTSDNGEEVNFSEKDQQVIANMLEVPYLYLSSYENSDGVPINIAAYTAVWMAAHDGGTAETYPSNPVVLNLFKYYGQTVVNFKSKVNDVESTPIKYNKKTDTFTVSKYPEKKQTVKITKIEDLGNNNFYKVTGSVADAGKIKKVVAVVQKNKLDTSLGFSIKALKWS